MYLDKWVLVVEWSSILFIIWVLLNQTDSKTNSSFPQNLVSHSNKVKNKLPYNTKIKYNPICDINETPPIIDNKVFFTLDRW